MADLLRNYAVHQQRTATASGNDGSETLTEEDGQRNFGELKAMWEHIQEHYEDVRLSAIDEETPARARKLNEIPRHQYEDVLIQLFNYGWIGDQESDLAIELAVGHRQNRRWKRVDADQLKRFRKIYREWLKS